MTAIRDKDIHRVEVAMHDILRIRCVRRVCKLHPQFEQ